MRASTRYVSRFPSFEINWTCPGVTGAPLCGLSWNQFRGMRSTKTKIRMTATSYCHVPRSYDQKNVRERIWPRLAISIRRHSVDDNSGAHVSHAVEIGGCFRVVRDHDDGLAQIFIQLPQHLQHDFRVFRIQVSCGPIARAIINEPKILLADEPTGNLDSKNSEIVLQMLRQLNKDLGQTIVMITHNPEATTYFDRVVHMRDGVIVDGVPAD